MKKLKIKLFQIKNIVLMEVLEQDSRTRGEGKLFISGELSLESLASPELREKAVLIRGTNTKRDTLMYSISFTEIEKADKYIRDVKKLVKEYNLSLGENDFEKVPEHDLKFVIAE